MYNSSVLSLSEARFFYLPSKKRIFAQNYYIVIFKDLQLNTPLHNALVTLVLQHLLLFKNRHLELYYPERIW